MLIFTDDFKDKWGIRTFEVYNSDLDKFFYLKEEYVKNIRRDSLPYIIDINDVNMVKNYIFSKDNLVIVSNDYSKLLMCKNNRLHKRLSGVIDCNKELIDVLQCINRCKVCILDRALDDLGYYVMGYVKERIKTSIKVNSFINGKESYIARSDMEIRLKSISLSNSFLNGVNLVFAIRVDCIRVSDNKYLTLDTDEMDEKDLSGISNPLFRELNIWLDNRIGFSMDSTKGIISAELHPSFWIYEKYLKEMG